MSRGHGLPTQSIQLAGGQPLAGRVVLRPVAFDLRGDAFLRLLPPEGSQPLCPSLPGPAGSGPVADADPAVPVRQLQAAPAGQQLRVHPHPAGRSLSHKDTVSFRCPLSSPGPSQALCPAAFALCHARGHCSLPTRPSWSPGGGSPETHPRHSLHLVPSCCQLEAPGSLRSSCVSPDSGHQTPTVAFPHHPREASGTSVVLSPAVLWLVSLDELTRCPHLPQSRSSSMAGVRRCDPKAWGPPGLPLGSFPQHPWPLAS